MCPTGMQYSQSRMLCAHCAEKPFSTEGFDGCGNRSNQRHNFTQKIIPFYVMRKISRGILRSSPKRIPNHKQTNEGNFKMIRYYGAYCRRTKRKYAGYLQRSIRQATFEDFITKVNKWAPKCPNCGRKMTFVCYEKGPPIENEVFGCKLSDWNHPWLSHS